MNRSLALAFGVLFLGACGSDVSAVVVQQRAASDLSCPQNVITVQKTGERQYNASGCGQLKSYKCVQNGASSADMTCTIDEGTAAPPQQQ